MILRCCWRGLSPAYVMSRSCSCQLSNSTNQKVYNQTEGTGWYIFVNSNGYHLYSNGTNLRGRNSSPYTYESLLGFTSTGSAVQVVVPSTKANNLYKVSGNTNNSNVTVGSTTGQEYEFTGTELYYHYRRIFTEYIYWWRMESNTGNVQTSETTTNRTFSVLPVTLNSPE